MVTYRCSKGKPIRDLLSRTFQLQARSASVREYTVSTSGSAVTWHWPKLRSQVLKAWRDRDETCNERERMKRLQRTPVRSCNKFKERRKRYYHTRRRVLGAEVCTTNDSKKRPGQGLVALLIVAQCPRLGRFPFHRMEHEWLAEIM